MAQSPKFGCVAKSKNQQWISVMDGTFQWAGTNKCTDPTDGKITDGNVPKIYTCDSKNTNQQWRSDTNPDSARWVLCVWMIQRKLNIDRAVNIIGGVTSE
jgi:hypothetical protein